MNQIDVVSKAQSTLYIHKNWYQNSNKSVYDAIKYYVESGDFSLDLKRTYMRQGSIDGLPSTIITVKGAVSYCKEHIDTHWKYLRIKYNGREGGSDAGKLKLQTFIAYSNLKDVADYIKKEFI